MGSIKQNRAFVEEGIGLLKKDIARIAKRKEYAPAAFYNLANGYYVLFSFRRQKDIFFSLFKKSEIEQAKKYYLTINQIASTVRSAFRGGVATTVKPSKAEKEIDVALQIDNNNALAHIENARKFINKPGLLGGDINKGIEILNNVAKDNPGLEKGYINLGIAYQENGEVEKAINTFNRLLEINPDTPEARFFLDQLISTK